VNFEQFVLANETAIRLGFFVGMLALIGAWEIVAPRRALTLSKAQRWSANLGLVALNTVLLRVIFPLAGPAWLPSAPKTAGASSIISRCQRSLPCRWR